MEWVTNLKGKTIGLDTAPLIYFIEEHPIYLEAILTFFEAVERAEAAAQLRSSHNIRTPDAIQIAAAMHAGASHFLTNDARLPAIPSLTILALDDVIRVAKM